MMRVNWKFNAACFVISTVTGYWCFMHGLGLAAVFNIAAALINTIPLIIAYTRYKMEKKDEKGG